MDLVKGLAIVLVNRGSAINFKGFPVLDTPPVPVITIPTLAGTGSEIAFNAVFTDSDKKMRLGINSELNYPKFSIIDSELSINAPKFPTLFGFLDCLNHITEGFISSNSFEFSRQFSISGFRLWYKSINQYLVNPRSIEARENMFFASIFANMALNNVGSGLGGDFSYPLGQNLRFHTALEKVYFYLICILYM